MNDIFILGRLVAVSCLDSVDGGYENGSASHLGKPGSLTSADLYTHTVAFLQPLHTVGSFLSLSPLLLRVFLCCWSSEMSSGMASGSLSSGQLQNSLSQLIDKLALTCVKTLIQSVNLRRIVDDVP